MSILTDYLSGYDITLGKNPRVLNIGCGKNVKWNFLGVTFYLAGQGLGFPVYVGVDQNEDAFGDARKVLGDLVTLITCDAQDLGNHVEGTFQLVIVEHPDLATSRDGPRKWRRIFEQARKLLDEQGALILTSFWLNDHIPAQVALEKSLYRILYSGRNAYPGRRFDTSNNGEPLIVDKYIILAKKL
ncbi:MAG: methyltransferase domain-containing protein [Deltaproteobacteria bacterium]|nr:methyltransferase domain-containing protein [Deltaproteobacteria bacterium]